MTIDYDPLVDVLYEALYVGDGRYRRGWGRAKYCADLIRASTWVAEHDAALLKAVKGEIDAAFSYGGINEVLRGRFIAALEGHSTDRQDAGYQP